MIFALLGGNVLVVAATIWFAHSDHGFVIVPEYDVKAARHQDRLDADLKWTARGWRIEVDPAVAGSTLALRIVDGDGRTIGGGDHAPGRASAGAAAESIVGVAATIFHHASAHDRLTVPLSPAGDGRWVLAPGPQRPGRWRIALVVSVSADRASERIERELDLDVRTIDDATVAGSAP